MSLKYTSSGSEFKIQNIPDGLVAVFSTSTDSNFIKDQNNKLQPLSTKLKEQGIEVFFVTAQELQTDIPNFILDENSEILNLVKSLNDKQKSGENLVLFKKEGGTLTYLVHKEKPEHQYNWITVIDDFSINYVNPNPDDKNLYKWGQVVPEDGDYLCVDCGFIESFSAGDIFPVCEVCLSGEPAGPTSSDGAYWEKV